ncbi:MAG: hypothetical protein ACR2G7_05775 [Acidimicrobiales bacterium]
MPFNLGTLKLTDDAVQSCAEGSECRSFKVDCPGVASSAPGAYRRLPHFGAARGLAVFFSGGPGTAWWGGSSASVGSFFDGLRADGIDVVEIKWGDGGWLESSPGERVGPARLACRPATAVKWVHDNLYLPLGVEAGPQQCGFCITGNSGGASQVAFALSDYGLDPIVDGAFPTSGPPHSALAKACLRRPGEEQYWYEPDEGARVIDRSYGFTDAEGPCVDHDPSWASVWQQDSVDTGGTDYGHPSTRVHVIVGASDRDPRMHAHAADYLARLQAAGTDATMEVVGTMGHDITESPEGLGALRAGLLYRP